MQWDDDVTTSTFKILILNNFTFWVHNSWTHSTKNTHIHTHTHTVGKTAAPLRCWWLWKQWALLTLISLIPLHEAGKCQVSNISSPTRWSFYFSERTLNRIRQRRHHSNVSSWFVFQREQRRRRKLPIKPNPQVQTSHYRHMSSGKCPGSPPPC